MTWAQVRSQIVTIMETDATPGTELGLPARFRHVKTSDDENPPKSRDFWIALRSGSVAYPNGATCVHRFADVELTVAYENHLNAAGLDEAIGLDYEAIATALLDATTWDRSTSGVESIAMLGGETMLEYGVEEVDGGRLLVIAFPVQYRN